MDTQQYKPKTETISSMSNLYGVNRKTFVKLIEPIKHKILKTNEKRYILSIREVTFICEYLGYPQIKTTK
jgi:hypothetical protein